MITTSGAVEFISHLVNAVILIVLMITPFLFQLHTGTGVPSPMILTVACHPQSSQLSGFNWGY